MFLADYHTHSNFSFDGKDDLAALCQAALSRGLLELCVTDHFDSVSGFDPAPRQAALCEARERFAGRLRLLFGVELGEYTQIPDRADALLASSAFDFVLGSYHNLAGEEDFYCLDYPDIQTCRGYLDRYFDEVRVLCERAPFHALGHLTYPLRYMTGRGGHAIDPMDWEGPVRAIFRRLVEAGRGLELNVSGLRTGGILMPDAPLLRFYRACGGELVTVGSDAHRAADIGAGIAEGYAVLRDCGFAYVTTFCEGEPSFVRL